MSQGATMGETSQQYLNAVVDTPPPVSFFRYILPLIAGRKVLDVGSGAGQYLKHFPPGAVGIDISQPNIDLCREKGLNVRPSDFNVRLDCENHEFEVVFCSHVLEHVDAPINLLRECNRCLCDDGMLIVAVPIEFSIVRLLRDHYFRDHPEHLYAFSIDNLKWLLLKAGFTFERTFVDLRKVEKWRLIWLLDLFQKLPTQTTFWFSNAYWMVVHKSTSTI